MLDAGVSAADLKSAGYNLADLKAGFNLADTKPKRDRSEICGP